MALIALIGLLATGFIERASATLPPGNSVSQWNTIAENTVVGSGAFQNEALIYMAYVSAAVYDAVVSIEGGYQPYASAVAAPRGASTDAAVVEAAYRTLLNYFPVQSAALGAYYVEALGLIPDGPAKVAGQAVGLASANNVIGIRTGDGRSTVIGATSPFPTLPPGPGVYRRTPTAFAAPQTPWVAGVRPFILRAAEQFLPDGPPSLLSSDWSEAFGKIKEVGSATSGTRTADQTAVALFWSANVVRQYNRLGRDLAEAYNLGLTQTARLTAMINIVVADAQISCMFAKYHFLFWRPVTAIDPTAVIADGFGPVPGYDDGNPATTGQVGWRPLLATPNHPEYPSAHGTASSSVAEVLTRFLGTSRIEVDIHGFDATGPAGNLNAVRHFAKARDLRQEIIHARLWAGLHYQFSTEAGVELGRDVAKYDLRHAFHRTEVENDDD